MAYLLRYFCSFNTKIFFSKKAFANLKYSSRIMVFLIRKKVILVFLSGWINISTSEVFEIFIWSINILKFSFNTSLANFFLSMKLTYLVISRTLTLVKNFWINSFFCKLDVYITKSREKYFWNYFHIYIGSNNTCHMTWIDMIRLDC